MIERKPDGTIDIDSLDTIENYQSELPPLVRKIVLLMTGSGPGTGASTAESILSQVLALESAGAGLYQRAVAVHFKHFFEIQIALVPIYHPHLDQEKKSDRDKINREIWKKFTQEYFTPEFRLRSIDGIKVRLEEVINNYSKELYDQANLVFFREHQRKYGLNNRNKLVQKVSGEFDKIPDLISYQALTQDVPEHKLGLSVEGKVVTRIDDIAEANLTDDNRDAFTPLETSDDMAVIRLFLQGNEQKSAKLVFKRQIIKGAITPPSGITKEEVLDYLNVGNVPEGRDSYTFETWVREKIDKQRAENVKRMRDDYERWSELYGIPLSQEYFAEKADAIIDTSELDELGTALAALENIAGLVPELSHVILDCLALQFREPQSFIRS